MLRRLGCIVLAGAAALVLLIGGNFYWGWTASGPAQNGTPGLNGLCSVVQGSLEGSNVDVVEELVSMIETQRAYEMNAKAISTTDSMLGYLNNNV